MTLIQRYLENLLYFSFDGSTEPGSIEGSMSCFEVHKMLRMILGEQVCNQVGYGLVLYIEALEQGCGEGYGSSLSQLSNCNRNTKYIL